MKLFKKHKTVASTPFSDFIRNASAGTKKRVYGEVLRKATERQNAVRPAKSEAIEQQ